MFVIGNFLSAVALVLDKLLSAYMFIILIRVLISWVNADPYNPIVQFLRSATDPVLYRVRRSLPLNFGGIDFSPIIVIAGIMFLQTFLVQSLLDLARTLH
jgi:YggT family protein